jgi:hypothetical protein
MTDLDRLKQDRPRLRMVANSLNADECLNWNADERARFNNELRWCVEAVKELDARMAARLSL